MIDSAQKLDMIRGGTPMRVNRGLLLPAMLFGMTSSVRVDVRNCRQIASLNILRLSEK